MIIAALAPIDTCGSALPAGQIHCGCSRRLVSPDGRWQVVIKGEDETLSHAQLDRPLRDDTAFVADRAGHVVASFDMQRQATLYWLKDGRHLVVNYFAGSDTTVPLVIRLGEDRTKPVDLSKLIFPDVLRRIHKRPAQVYHYYVWFLADEDDRITIAAEPNYTLKGTEGPGGGRCLIYSVDKATFHGYRLVREVPDEKCPETSEAP